MTDAREIIESLLPISHLNDELRKSRAQHIIDALAAAGIRILGKGEVDSVTVEKCAEVSEMYISMGWRGTEITEAIRAIRQSGE